MSTAERPDFDELINWGFAVAELYQAGVLCPVVEYANTENEVLHIGVNPDYFRPE